MSIKHLVNSGAIVGFTNLGNATSCWHMRSTLKMVLRRRKRWLSRGLFTKLQFAYAQFPCSSVCGYHMYDIFWEAVERLERCEFRVLACTCDGLSVNRNFFKLHGDNNAVHKVLNPYANDGRFIFFLSDPPHLIKTTRNCWASKKRLMWVG